MNQNLVVPEIRLLLLDESPVCRIQIRCLIETLDIQARITVDEAGATHDGVSSLPQHSYDVVIAGIHGGALAPIEAVRQAVTRYRPDVTIFIASNQRSANLSAMPPTDVDYLQWPIEPATATDTLRQHLLRVAVQKRRVMEVFSRINIQLGGRILKALYGYSTGRRGAIETHVMPRDVVSGDFVLTAQSPRGREVILIADCIGHAVPPVLAAIAIVPAFESLVAQDVGIDEIAMALNIAVREMMPKGVYVSAGLLTVTMETGDYQLVSCGIPPVVVVGSGSCFRLESKIPPLGLIADDNLPVVAQGRLARDQVMWLYTDGALDSVGDEGINSWFAASAAASLGTIIDKVLKGKAPAEDLAVVRIKSAVPQSKYAAKPTRLTGARAGEEQPAELQT
jgi:hypothetical protein